MNASPPVLETPPKEAAIPARTGKIELPWLVLAALLISTVFGAGKPRANSPQKLSNALQSWRPKSARSDTTHRGHPHGGLQRRAFSAAQPKADVSAWRQFIERMQIDPVAVPGLVALRQHVAAGGAPFEWTVPSKTGSSRPWESAAVFAATDPSTPAFSMPMQPQGHSTFYVMRIAVPNPPDHRMPMR